MARSILGPVITRSAASLSLLLATACGRLEYDPLGRVDGGDLRDGAFPDAAFDAPPIDGAPSDAIALDSGDGAPADGGARDAGRSGPGTCVPSSDPLVLSVPVTGTTVGSGDDTTGACGFDGSDDVAYRWTAPMDGTYRFAVCDTTEAWDPIIYVRAATCDGPELACDDDMVLASCSLLSTFVELAMSGGQTVVVIVDSLAPEGGAFTLTVTQR